MFCKCSRLTRLKTSYLFCESDCRYKTDVRFSENLQRFALCCTLCCPDVALCIETPQFLLHRCPMKGLVPPDRCARNPVQRKAPGGHPSIGRKSFTRLHFCVWKHDMVLAPRSGSSLVVNLPLSASLRHRLQINQTVRLATVLSLNCDCSSNEVPSPPNLLCASSCSCYLAAALPGGHSNEVRRFTASYLGLCGARQACLCRLPCLLSHLRSKWTFTCHALDDALSFAVPYRSHSLSRLMHHPASSARLLNFFRELVI